MIIFHDDYFHYKLIDKIHTAYMFEGLFLSQIYFSTINLLTDNEHSLIAVNWMYQYMMQLTRWSDW